jgi:hypothetical protein
MIGSSRREAQSGRGQSRPARAQQASATINNSVKEFDGQDETEIPSTEVAEEQVLAKFDASEWVEAQTCDVCIQRIAELKHEWGEEFYPELMKHETPEVRDYG